MVRLIALRFKPEGPNNMIMNVASENPGPPQLSPDGKWLSYGARWAPVTQSGARSTGTALPDLVTLAVIAMRLWVLFPLGLGALLAILTPTYWRPVLSSALGIAILTAGVIVIAGGFVLTEVAGRLMRRGGGGLAAGIALLAGTFSLQFITLWIVLLGPAIVIVVTTKQPS
jgi:hypothetical protein